MFATKLSHCVARMALTLGHQVSQVSQGSSVAMVMVLVEVSLSALAVNL